MASDMDKTMMKRTRMTRTQKRAAERELENTVPPAFRWSYKDVEKWIIELGFPLYKECFTTNFIDGKKLILITQSTLPEIGITDFEHIKIIASAVRELLGVEKSDWHRSISLPPREKMATYLLLKSRTGRTARGLTFVRFIRANAKEYGELDF